MFVDGRPRFNHPGWYPGLFPRKQEVACPVGLAIRPSEVASRADMLWIWNNGGTIRVYTVLVELASADALSITGARSAIVALSRNLSRQVDIPEVSNTCNKCVAITESPPSSKKLSWNADLIEPRVSARKTYQIFLGFGPRRHNALFAIALHLVGRNVRLVFRPNRLRGIFQSGFKQFINKDDDRGTLK